MSRKIGTVVIDIKADTAKLVTGMERAEKVVGRTISSIKSTIVSLVSAYAGLNSAQKLVSDGFSFNRSLENAKAGLVALSVAVQDKSIPVMERYSIANREATKTLIELQKINIQTPHTLEQTNKIYKSMYVSMKKAGASNKDMIELTRSLSIASGAAGIEFNSLLAGVDGLATGTVLANSDLGRFLSSLGLTNKKLKESKNVVKLLKDTFKDFKSADTMSVAMSNLENSWNQLAGELTKDIFASSKEDIKALSGGFEELTHWVHEYKLQIDSLDEVKLSSGTEVLNKQLELAKKRLEELKLYSKSFGKQVSGGLGTFDILQSYIESKESLAGKIAKQEAIIAKIKRKYRLAEAEEEKAKAKSIHEFKRQKTDEEIKAEKKLHDEKIKDSQEWIQQLIEFDKYDPWIDGEKKASASLSVWADYYARLKDYKTSWLVSQDRVTATTNADLMGLKGADYDRYVNDYKTKYLDRLKQESEKSSKQINYVFTNAFKNMEDSLVNFVKTGKLDFKSLTNSILEDMLRMQIQQSITKPLMAGFTSAGGLSGIFGGIFANAHGGAYASASLSEYSNQVIDKPTPFMFANGGVPNLGVFGEAGAEAIMPLTRIGGDLGVKSSPSNVIINIENNSGQDISAEQISELTRTNERGEQERVITFVIDGVNRNMNGVRDLLKGIR